MLRKSHLTIKMALEFVLLQVCLFAPLVTLGNQLADWSEFYIHMRRSLNYPHESRLNNIQGDVIVQFQVSSGLIDSLVIHTTLNPEFDAAVVKSIKKFPDFKSVNNGKYSFKVCFRLQNVTTAIVNEDAVSPKGYQELEKLTLTMPNAEMIIYDFASIQKQPEFPGGMKAFTKYLEINGKYPERAQSSGIQGKVFLSFVIERDGSLGDIRVDRKLGYGLDEEAVRLLKNSPKWSPGIQRDRVVRVKYNISIPFEL